MNKEINKSNPKTLVLKLYLRHYLKLSCLWCTIDL